MGSWITASVSNDEGNGDSNDYADACDYFQWSEILSDGRWKYCTVKYE